MLLNKDQLGRSVTEHLLSLQLNTTDGPVNLLCVYAPTLTAPDDIKDDFYSQLDTIIKGFPKQEGLVILGDINAHIGSDNKAWPNYPGHFGVLETPKVQRLAPARPHLNEMDTSEEFSCHQNLS